MWRFANLFMLLFFFDGVISLMDDVAVLAFGVSTLHTLRGFFAFLPFVLSFPLYFLTGCMAGFPKRVLLPMALFQIWCGIFLALPLPIYLGVQRTNLLLSSVQLFMSIIASFYLHQTTQKKTWFFTAADFSHLVFGWKRVVGFVAANVIVVVPLLTVYLAACISIAASHLSRGFILLDMDGISIEARTYTHQGRHLYLLPTFHVAESNFFRTLIESLPESSTAVILEGVTDKHGLAQTGLNYSQLAHRLGLEAQDNRIFMARHAVKRCDVDISYFSAETRSFINAASRSMQQWSSGNRITALTESMLSPRPNPNLLWQDLVEMRNRRVIECMHRFMEEYDNLLVPWGAAHMPGLEKEVLKWGAILKNRRRVRVLNWRHLKQYFQGVFRPDASVAMGVAFAVEPKRECVFVR